jgi:hypothetical protein
MFFADGARPENPDTLCRISEEVARMQSHKVIWLVLSAVVEFLLG